MAVASSEVGKMAALTLSSCPPAVFYPLPAAEFGGLKIDGNAPLGDVARPVGFAFTVASNAVDRRSRVL